MRPLLCRAADVCMCSIVFSVVLIVFSCEMVNRWNKGLTKTPAPVHFSLSYGGEDGRRLSRSLGGLNKTHHRTLLNIFFYIFAIYLSIYPNIQYKDLWLWWQAVSLSAEQRGFPKSLYLQKQFLSKASNHYCKPFIYPGFYFEGNCSDLTSLNYAPHTLFTSFLRTVYTDVMCEERPTKEKNRHRGVVNI